MPPADVETASSSLPQGSCYRIQVLVVGRHKRWRDEVSTQVRMLGYQVTACDRGVDAMTVLALGLPVDVMVVDTALQGGLCCAQLAVESRALRPALRIILASDPVDAVGPDASARVPDALLVRRDQLQNGMVATTMREALANRAALSPARRPEKARDAALESCPTRLTASPRLRAGSGLSGSELPARCQQRARRRAAIQMQHPRDPVRGIRAEF